VFFETYPSAFVRLNYPQYANYKKLKEPGEESTPNESRKDQESRSRARVGLRDTLVKGYRIDITDCASSLSTACLTPASDAFDGFLSAIGAWDYLKWRAQQDGAPRMFSPKEILGAHGAAKEQVRLTKEGWCIVRLPADMIFFVCSHNAGNNEGSLGDEDATSGKPWQRE
jgi:hypothetical protein